MSSATHEAVRFFLVRCQQNLYSCDPVPPTRRALKIRCGTFIATDLFKKNKGEAKIPPGWFHQRNLVRLDHRNSPHLRTERGIFGDLLGEGGGRNHPIILCDPNVLVRLNREMTTGSQNGASICTQRFILWELPSFVDLWPF